MEADAISSFAKEHRETCFINATGGGIGFEGIENASLEDALEKYATTTWDLTGRIHQWIENNINWSGDFRIDTMLHFRDNNLDQYLKW